MKTFRILLVISALVGRSNAADGIRFSHKHLMESATDIVLVTEGLIIDGDVTVLATYKGIVREGSHIKIPELEAFGDPERRKTSSSLFSKQKNNPEHAEVTCKLMILFLVSDGDSIRPPEYIADSWIYWIEDGVGYARNQEQNPGTSDIREFTVPLEEVLEDIQKMQNKAEMATPRKPSD